MNSRIWMAVAILLSGCANHRIEEPLDVTRDKVVFADGLERSLKAESPVLAERSGIAIAQVDLVSRTNRRQTILYAFDWFDPDGLTLGRDLYDWRKLTLAGGEVRAVSAAAPSPKATDFRLRVRRP
ncbi:MAG: YcfL family protein [bacterium]|nr:YcfL family protein [bacterium]